MAAVLKPALEIRAMRRADLGRISEIEEASYPFPWTKGIFTDCLRVGYRCYVLTSESRIAGYAIVSMAMDESHLLNLCIAPDFRRQGLARLLLGHVVDELGLIGLARLFLEVRPSNPGAVALYEAFGFRQIGRRPGYYPADGCREDALIMALRIDEMHQ